MSNALKITIRESVVMFENDMNSGYQIARLGALLLNLSVDHQSRYILVTTETSPSCLSNHAPLRGRSVE
jgi:hypothetical protein